MNTYTKTDNNKNQLILDIINNHADYKDKLEPRTYGETDEEREARLELTKIYIKEVKSWKQSVLWYLNKTYEDFSKVEKLVLDKRGKCNNINGTLIAPLSIWDIYTSIDFNETLVKGQKLEGGGMSGFTNLKKLVIGGNIETVSGLENLINLEELIITSEKFQGNIAQFEKLTTLKKLDIKKERDGVYRTYVKGFTGNLESLKPLEHLEELNIEGNWALEGGLGQLPDSLIKLHYKNTVYAPVLDTFGGNYQLWRSLKDDSKPINRKVWDKNKKEWKTEKISIDAYLIELQTKIASPSKNDYLSSRPHDPKENPQVIIDIINRERKPYNLVNVKEIQVNNLEIQIKNKDNEIKDRDKTIQSLQLKNEKLTGSYKKLIQHLADARLLVSHLQKDLSATQQDKTHIQKELNDALAILNKPKPVMVDMETQTELTYHDINRMETLEKKVIDFVKNSNIIKDENKKQDILFRLQIIERGTASLEEDMEHSKTQGQEMKRQIELLEEDVQKGKITEIELDKRVKDLEQLIKRKESQFQKKIKIKDKEWEKTNHDLNQISELYVKNNQALIRANKEKEQLETQITEKNNEIGKIKKDLEDSKKKGEVFLEEIKQTQKLELNVYEKELIDKVITAFNHLKFSFGIISAVHSNPNAFIKDFEQIMELENWKEIEEKLEFKQWILEKIKRASEGFEWTINLLEQKWDEEKYPTFSKKYNKDKLIKFFREIKDETEEDKIGELVVFWLKNIIKVKSLKKKKQTLKEQIGKENESLERLAYFVSSLETEVEDNEVKLSITRASQALSETRSRFFSDYKSKIDIMLKDLIPAVSYAFKDRKHLIEKLSEYKDLEKEKEEAYEKIKEYLEGEEFKFENQLLFYRNSNALGINWDKDFLNKARGFYGKYLTEDDTHIDLNDINQLSEILTNKLKETLKKHETKLNVINFNISGSLTVDFKPFFKKLEANNFVIIVNDNMKGKIDFSWLKKIGNDDWETINPKKLVEGNEKLKSSTIYRLPGSGSGLKVVEKESSGGFFDFGSIWIEAEQEKK